MRASLRKAQEITNAQIQFVSLVDKAANKRTFLLKKEEGGKATFTTYGRIVKTDSENHYVTGIVYSPMTEDSQGNFMTEAEITKAAYWFAKNGDKVDIQHSFEPFDGATIVENWIAKADFDIDGEQVSKGTWLMTMEVSDASVWEAIEKGELTGFSMGGIGNYSEEDVDLENVNKYGSTNEKKSLIKQLAKLLGLDTVTKDATIDRPIEKAGRKMSGKNKETLAGIYDSLGTFLKEFDDPEEIPEDTTSKKKEDDKMEKQDIEQIAEAVAKALGKQPKGDPATLVEKHTAPEGSTLTAAITQEAIEKMVAAAIEKATVPQQQVQATPITAEEIGSMIEAAVAKAMEPVLKAKGFPSNLGSATVEKGVGEEPHYLHGIL